MGLCMLRKMTCGHLVFVGSGWQSFVLWWVFLPGIFVLLLRAWSQDLPGLCLLGGRRKNADVFGVSRKWLADEDGFIARGRDCWWLLYRIHAARNFKISSVHTNHRKLKSHPANLSAVLSWRNTRIFDWTKLSHFRCTLGDLFQASDWWHHWQWNQSDLVLSIGGFLGKISWEQKSAPLKSVLVAFHKWVVWNHQLLYTFTLIALMYHFLKNYSPEV